LDPSVSLEDRKAAARHAARDRRKPAHGQADVGAAQAALAGLLAAYPDAVVAGYLPIRTEIDPRPVMAARARRGTVCVPVVDGPALPLGFRRWRADAAMVTGPFGIEIPQDPDPVTPDLVILPLLAFDAAGYRLGYGGGYYDRTLDRMRAQAGRVLAIGFAYAAQEAAYVPRDGLDQRLDAVVTEYGLRWFTPPTD